MEFKLNILHIINVMYIGRCHVTGVYNSNFMKYIFIIAGIILLFSCKNSRQNTSKVGLGNTTDKIENEICEYVDVVDTTIDGTSLRIYIPEFCNINMMYGNDIPDGKYMNTLYCAAAAYTDKGWEKGFSHSLVAGKHVSDGIIYDGYSCLNNTGAFVWYNGQYSFLYKDYIHEFELAAKDRYGVAFAQEMLIHHKDSVPTIRNINAVDRYRALCDMEECEGRKIYKRLCVIESTEKTSLRAFVKAMLDINVVEGLYLDMGGWSYSWYRNNKGEVVRTFPKGKEKLSNALVFMGAN